MLDSLLGLRPGRPHLDLVATDGAERGDPAETCRGHRAGTGGEVPELHRRVHGAYLADQPRGRPRVQAVGVLHREDPDHLLGTRLRHDAGGGLGQVRGLAHQGVAGLGRDLRAARSPGRGDGRDHESLDDGCRRQRHPVPRGRVVEEVQGQLGAQQGTAEVHQYDDAARTVGALDRGADAHRVGPQRRLVQPGRHLDPQRPAVQHLLRQHDRGLGQRPAVGHDDESHLLGRAAGSHGWNARVAASSSSATVVAPGSWWPTLRSPR